MRKITKEKILEVVRKNLGDITLDGNHYDNDLLEIGIDSIVFIRIVIELEELFDCEFPDEKLLITELNTIDKIYDVLVSISKNNLQE